MSYPAAKSTNLRSYRILPWLHFTGTVILVFSSALFSAVFSPLGQAISAGESPGFAWVRSNISICLGFCLVYLIIVCWLQMRYISYYSSAFQWLVKLLVVFEVVAIAATAILLFYHKFSLLHYVQPVLLLAILTQGVLSFLKHGLPDLDQNVLEFQEPAWNSGIFLILLFLLGAVISFIEPSWRRMSDQVILDSDLEYFLRYIFPPILSGITSAWFGFGVLAILLGFSHLRSRLIDKYDVNRIIHFLTFLCLASVFTALFLGTLFHAISWQIHALELVSGVGRAHV